MTTRNPITYLTSDDQFVDRVIGYSVRYDELQDALKNHHPKEAITLLRQVLSTERTWLHEKLVEALTLHKDYYYGRFARLIELPADLPEALQPVLEVRKLKDMYTKHQKYEEAAKYRDQERKLLEEPVRAMLVEFFNDAVVNELRGCTSPQDYYVTGCILLDIQRDYLDTQYDPTLKGLEHICTKWLLTEVAKALELGTDFDHELALAMLAMKKLKWEHKLVIR